MFNRFANFHFVTRAALMVLLIASPWLVVQVGIAILGPDREITEMPVCEANSGNCAHLGGGDDYRLNDIYPTSLNQSSNLVYDKLIDFIDSKDLELIYQTSDGGNYHVHFVEKTKFWQFPDDVIVTIQSTDDGSIIEIHSESRVGWGDLGLNPERIDAIYSALE